MAKKKSEDEEEDGGGKKKIMMIVGGLLLLGGVYNFVLKPAPPAEAMEPVEMEPVEGEIFELPEMVINLNDDEVQYVRFGVALILEEGTLAADFEAESAIAKDVVLDIVSPLSAEDLRGDAKQEIKDEISAKVREAYGDEKVVRALITTLVMQ